MSSTSLTLRERAWLPLEQIRTIGPLTGITAAAVRDALTGLHRADPEHRAVSRLDRAAAAWEHLDDAGFAAQVREAVTDLGPGPLDFEAMTRSLQDEPLTGLPVRVLVGGGYVAVRVSRAYGDAEPVNALLRELVRAAYAGRAASLTPFTAQPWALPKAWLKQVGLRPNRWRGGLSTPKPPRRVPAATRPWKASLVTASVRSTRVLGEMRTWRDRHGVGATSPAIALAAFAAALVELGLDPDLSGGLFLADARWRLGQAAGVDGNFSIGSYLSPQSLINPGPIDETFTAELAGGRILTSMLLRSGRLLVTRAPRTPEPYPEEIAIEPRPRLVLDDQGRHDLLGDLPWGADPAGRIDQSALAYCEPEDVVLAISEMDGVLHLDATFHSTTYDPVVVQRALDLVCSDPAGLITAAAR
ncbi:hypothetical protein [Actinoplanes sp. NPDC020271]|uniref:hypothetical protein n=1 Tax=Actinoplanes sp. NPDC020271 TaxID=3363896 RepID=UPI00378E7B26